jgi:hypothetical protein
MREAGHRLTSLVITSVSQVWGSREFLLEVPSNDPIIAPPLASEFAAI